MDDWAKALISTGFGFAAGLASEPVKLWLGTWAKAKSARRALYSDMGRVYHLLNRFYDVCHGPSGFESTSQSDQDRATEWLRSSKTDVLRHYSTADQAVFFRIPEFEAIVDVYKSIAEAAEAAERPWADRYVAVMRVFEVFDNQFKRGALDADLVLKCRAKHRKRTVTQVEQYHRLSAEQTAPLIRDSQLTGNRPPSILIKPEKK